MNAIFGIVGRLFFKLFYYFTAHEHLHPDYHFHRPKSLFYNFQKQKSGDE